MTGEKRNIHPGRCERCGELVPAGAGLLRFDSGAAGWIVTHESCNGERTTGTEAPRWAVPAEGLTSGGNRAQGLVLVDGPRPRGEAYPVNAAAHALTAVAALPPEDNAARLTKTRENLTRRAESAN